jgi:hypothetical protein
MKIIPLPQLRVEDFPKEQRKWLPQLFGPLNQFLTSITSALQQQLDFRSNTLGQEQNLSFAWSSDSASLPIKFALKISAPPAALYVCQASENKVPVIVVLAWQYTGGSVQITDIAKVSSGVVSSLVSGASYTLRVRLET